MDQILLKQSTDLPKQGSQVNTGFAAALHEGLYRLQGRRAGTGLCGAA